MENNAEAENRQCSIEPAKRSETTPFLLINHSELCDDAS